jgi:hypothetical protein
VRPARTGATPGRPTPAAGRKPGLAGVPPGPDPDSSTTRLREYLSSTEVRKNAAVAVRDRLVNISGLMTEGLTFLARVRRIWDNPGGKSLFLAPVALIAVALLIRLSGRSSMDAPDVPAGSPGHIWTYLVEGSCRVDEGPLGLGTILQPEVTLATQKGAELILMTPSGSRIVFKGEARARFEGVGKASDGKTLYRFKEPTGDILFDFEKGPCVELVFEGATISTISTARGVLRAGRKPKQPRTVAVEKGEARQVAAGKGSTLAAGQVATIK